MQTYKKMPLEQYIFVQLEDLNKLQNFGRYIRLPVSFNIIRSV
jgi:hypothetical protein